MSLFSNKAEEAGLDQLPDGRWTYTPISIFGRNKEGRRYFIPEEKKEKVFRAYKKICFFIPCYTTSLLLLLHRQAWVALSIAIIIGVIYALFIKFRFNKFSNGLTIYDAKVML